MARKMDEGRMPRAGAAIESASHPAGRQAPLTRRRLLAAAAHGLAWPWIAGPLLSLASPLSPSMAQARAEEHPDPSGSERLPVGLLESSPYVYVSPLRSDGRESRCHGELWFAWLDGSVVVTVASDRWKAEALGRGLDSARIWVGDHGRWKTLLRGRNEAFRAAPSFVARAEKATDEGLLDRLLATYERKYPAEIADWRERMKRGNADGSRIMIRSTPQ